MKDYSFTFSISNKEKSEQLYSISIKNCLFLFICYESLIELKTSKQRQKNVWLCWYAWYKWPFDGIQNIFLLASVSAQKYFTMIHKWDVNQIFKSFRYYWCNSQYSNKFFYLNQHVNRSWTVKSDLHVFIFFQQNKK